MPVFLLLFLLFMLWFTYERRKANKLSVTSNKDFWERERQADFVPKQSLDDVTFFSVPSDLVPEITDMTTSELRASIEELSELVGKEMTDLTGLTNTDIKLRYGTGNFTRLSLADGYYTRFVSLTAKLYELLCDDYREQDGLKLIRFAFDNGVHTKAVMLALANDYAKASQSDKIEELIRIAETDPNCLKTVPDNLRIILNDMINQQIPQDILD